MASAPIGQVVSHYRVVEQIGAGGMGVVYRARDERLDRDVALKVLPLGALSDVPARKRFRNEALALAKLNHSNIASIYDFDNHDGADFLVMEYVRGMTLSSLLTDGPLPQADVVAIGEQIARGLEAAHEVGVVHCDLKPANVILTSKEQVKLLDFGLARAFRVKDDAITESLSEQYACAGTLPYMPPEQVRGNRPDARTDIYALGAVLYEMATGRRPFPGRHAELIDAILNHLPVPPSTFNRQIAPSLQRIILKALDKNPEHRYQTAEQLGSELRSLHTSPSSPPNWRRWTWAGLLASIVLTFLMARAPIRNWVSRTAELGEPRQLAVLPFHDLDGDNADQAFIQGLVDNISTKLSELSRSHPLEVIPASEVRTSHVATSDEAKKELGASLVLEGSIQRVAGLRRINISLIDAGSHKLLRAEAITANYSDPFRLEDEIVQTAVRMLQLELRQNEQKLLTTHGTPNLKAYDLYTRGRGYLQESENPEDVESAINEFLQSINLDSAYAAAYAALGEAYWSKYQLTKDSQWIEKIRDACQRCVELDPGLPDGNICLGTLNNGLGKYQMAASEFELALVSDSENDAAYRGLGSAFEQMGSMEQAEQTYVRAVETKPRYVRSYSTLGAFYARRARYAEAAVQFEKAVSISPANAQYWSSLGGIYIVSGRYEEALKALQRAIQVRPSFEAYSNLGQTLFAMRRFEDAINAFEQSVALGQNQVQSYGNLARAYYWFPPKRHLAKGMFARAITLADNDLKVNPDDADAHTLAAEYSAMIGNRKDAMHHLNAALHLRPRDPETLFFAGIVYNLLNEPEKAIPWLEKSISAGYSPADVASTPELASLSNDPRFTILLKNASRK